MTKEEILKELERETELGIEKMLEFIPLVEAKAKGKISENFYIRITELEAWYKDWRSRCDKLQEEYDK